MPQEAPVLPYAAPKRPNPWGKWSLVGGIILLFGSFVPICGLAVVPLAWVGVIAGLVGVWLSIRGGRQGLVTSVSGSVICLAAAFIPIGILGAIPFLAEAGLKFWASKQNAPAPTTTPAAAPATAPSTMPAPTTGPAGE